MKIKDVARAFGKKFSCGTSVGETPTGLKEVVIQGDVIFQLPDILKKEYKVSSWVLIVFYQHIKNVNLMISLGVCRLQVVQFSFKRGVA